VKGEHSDQVPGGPAALGETSTMFKALISESHLNLEARWLRGYHMTLVELDGRSKAVEERNPLRCR
jgi:hypothetical protein